MGQAHTGHPRALYMQSGAIVPCRHPVRCLMSSVRMRDTPAPGSLSMSVISFCGIAMQTPYSFHVSMNLQSAVSLDVHPPRACSACLEPVDVERHFPSVRQQHSSHLANSSAVPLQ